MAWDVKYTDEFEDWWVALSENTQEDIDSHVRLLEERGPHLEYPFSSGLHGTRHSHMRELRVQSAAKPIRIFYAFDPTRTAILLIGGDKTGDKRFYERMLAVADRLYDDHLAAQQNENR
ncbi:type II toxin-antitoxin system RelE/ParE family toxin [Pseudomonas syringae]|uniref:type II toxin-antitoxin system RelE/ParE family toxin n=1 Tax=Pseudomonas syringae TaxID=317 RepID=UPI000736AA9E|nr:type II toxin-antitoxin system RelE/ParE family toxin [Pseudomonas syringae]KTB79726.1 addiction module toxin RelE [Pseudomonas syringae pv. syringae PD2766]